MSHFSLFGFFREYVVVKIGVSTRRAAPFQIVCVVFLGWLKDWESPEVCFSLVDWHIGNKYQNSFSHVKFILVGSFRLTYLICLDKSFSSSHLVVLINIINSIATVVG